jgi:pimeloyl-ACP methyl ester carboxylesterase
MERFMNRRVSKEAYVPVAGGHVWYRIVGNNDAVPLLVLHGGPGVPHDYLEPLEALADELYAADYVLHDPDFPNCRPCRPASSIGLAP